MCLKKRIVTVNFSDKICQFFYQNDFESIKLTGNKIFDVLYVSAADFLTCLILVVAINDTEICDFINRL